MGLVTSQILFLVIWCHRSFLQWFVWRHGSFSAVAYMWRHGSFSEGVDIRCQGSFLGSGSDLTSLFFQCLKAIYTWRHTVFLKCFFCCWLWQHALEPTLIFFLSFLFLISHYHFLHSVEFDIGGGRLRLKTASICCKERLRHKTTSIITW